MSESSAQQEGVVSETKHGASTDQSGAAGGDVILTIEDLSVSFSMYQKGLRKYDLEVIRSLSLDVRAGEILAVIGSSGSGKSLLAHAIMGILPSNAQTCGRMLYHGEALTEKWLRKLRGDKIAFIPQSPGYLDPLMRAGKQVIGTRSTRAVQEELFAKYRLAPEVAKLYPFQLSGGMSRRILFATAAAPGVADLIIADEPTPGLGEELANKMMHHFQQFADAGAGVLLITHDIDLALAYASRIAVLYAGTVVEIADTSDFADPATCLRHPYSKAFAEALPQHAFRAIAGTQPYAGDLGAGCSFAARCPMAHPECADKDIALRELRGGKVRCLYAT